jgi:branched-chain amino acid transport system substrate-binding protein
VTRFRTTQRLVTAAAATAAAVSLVAGCGGGSPQAAGSNSVVSQPQSDPAGAVASSDSSAADAKPAADAAAATTAKDAAPATTKKPAATTSSAAAPKAAKPGAAAPKVGLDSAAKTAVAPAAGAAGGSAAQRLVVSDPLFGGSGVCKPATLSEVALGNVSTFSGVLGELLSPVRPALETWAAAQNACGGLNGHRIQLNFEDDQGDPSTAAAKVAELIEKKKVLAFVGNIEALTVDAIVPVVNRYKIPVIGGDLVSNTWFTNPMLFPQSSPPQAVAYGYIVGSTEYHKATKLGDLYCIEVPRACEQLDAAFHELAKQVGASVVQSQQGSLTQPSFVQQCLAFKNAGVEALTLIVDAASMNRIARSCEQVDYNPKVVVTPLGVGNQKQFLTGNKWLGNTYVPMYFFPWMANDTPALKYWHASIAKFNPGFNLGGAASVGWTSGALLSAAAADLPAVNPTTADLMRGLYSFQGQKFTTLGGLTAPLTFRPGKTPKIPYCLFYAVSNDTNTDWAKWSSTAKCTDVIAPSDPQKNS